ncbi:MAG: HNH endonuclease, partial [Gammaproteobacteria bacterium]|nr:HNH endonuclease [Gammaproteobacteria bacterium]
LDGIRVSAETSRRMACDAAVVAMVHAKDGSMLSVGRRTRTIPPHIRRALEERDRGCRFPGCGCRFTEAHHVKHWADGGETSLGNTVLLCRRHHRAVHEGQVKLSVATDGTVVFFTRGGKMLADAPKQVWRDLAPVPSVHSGAPGKGDGIALSNGAALYRDSEIPWEIEAAAREAVEESLE